MFKLCMWIQSAFVISPVIVPLFPMCSLSCRLLSPSPLPCDPHSFLDSPVYIYLSLCTYTPSEHWSLSVPSSLYARLLRDDWRHPFVWLLPAPSGFVCLSAFCLWLLICLPRWRCSPAPWYLCTSAFWFWLLIGFQLLFCPVSLYCTSLINWLPNIKDHVFCILPGLHLVPYLSVRFWSFLCMDAVFKGRSTAVQFCQVEKYCMRTGGECTLCSTLLIFCIFVDYHTGQRIRYWGSGLQLVKARGELKTAKGLNQTSTQTMITFYL